MISFHTDAPIDGLSAIWRLASAYVAELIVTAAAESSAIHQAKAATRFRC
jgi:hypothetical protein